MTGWAVIALGSVARGRKGDGLVSRESVTEMDTQGCALAVYMTVEQEEYLASDILALVNIFQGKPGRECLIR